MNKRKIVLFSKKMLRQLELQNHTVGDWEENEQAWISMRLEAVMNDLEAALYNTIYKDGGPEDVEIKAVELANLAMMAADFCREYCKKRNAQ